MSELDERDRATEAAHAEHDFTGPLTPPVKRLLRALFAISALLFLIDFVIDRKVHQPAEKIPGFYALYGFVGCVVLVLVAKEMRKIVMRPEDYYDPEHGSEGENDAQNEGGEGR